MQPPVAFEEEFNAWYDTEHIPERRSIPGFETAMRYVCASGAPRYLAIYDMKTPGVLDSLAYTRVAFDNSSPWTKRVVSRVRVYRSAGVQVYPGNLVSRPSARAMLLRFRALDKSAEPGIIAGMQDNFEGLKETVQVRVFCYDTGASGIDFLGFVEARAPISKPLDVSAFGDAADALDLVNTYALY
jgi:hypothetical protein